MGFYVNTFVKALQIKSGQIPPRFFPHTNFPPIENLKEKDTRIEGTVATEGLPYQNGEKR